MGTCTSIPQVTDPDANATYASETDNDDDTYPSDHTESGELTSATTLAPPTFPDSAVPPTNNAGDASPKKGKAFTHILDLPKECLVEILRRVGGNAPLPIRQVAHDPDSARGEEHLPRVVIVHPLQCALVCKQWRDSADAAVSALTLRDLPLTEDLANDLGRRFPSLASFSLASADIESGEPLLTLARQTPLLHHLELRNMLRPRRDYQQPSPAAIWRKDLCDSWRLRSLLLSRCGNPESFGRFPHLESLRIHSIGKLPPDFGTNLPALRKLELAYGRVRELPPSLGSLASLEVLNLHNCPSLSALPESIGSLTALRELCVHACGLLSLPDGFFQNLTRLEVCELSDLRSLRELPEGIGNCRQLANLEITGCSIEALPEALGRLSALENLLISNCDELLSLPISFGGLHSLRALRLKDCKHLTEYVRRPEVKEVLSTLPECQVWVGSGDSFRLLRLKR